MPSLTTHKIIAENIFDKLSNNIKKNIDKNTYFTFAQSHDIFYYNMQKKYKRIGNMGHHQHTQSFIINIIQYIKDNKLEDNKQCVSYLYGVLTHYYLDSICHPYIFYKTGVNKNNKETIKYKGQHNLMERTIDSIIYEKKYNKKYKKCNITKEILPKLNLSKDLENLINHNYQTTYNIKNSSKILKSSYFLMRLFHKIIVEDSIGIKNKLYSFIDTISNNKSKCLHSYSTSIKLNNNYLNTNNNKWYHPCNINETCNKSLEDLLQEAENITIKIIDIINKFFTNKLDISIIKEHIKNIDYSTGLLIEENKKMRHFEY